MRRKYDISKNKEYKAPSKSYARKGSITKATTTSKRVKSSEKVSDYYGHDVKKLMELIGFTVDNTDNILGGTEWQNLWMTSLNAMQQRRLLPDATMLGIKSHNQDKTNKKSKSDQPSHGMKSKVEPTRSRPIAETELNSRPNSDAKTISNRNDKLRKNSETSSTTTATTKFDYGKSPYESDPMKKDTIRDVVKDLTKSEQNYLVDILEKLHNELGVDDISDDDEQQQHHQQQHQYDSKSILSVTTASTRTNHTNTDNKNSRRDLFTRNRLPKKYGRTIIRNTDDATQILRKIGMAMDTSAFKKLNYDLTGRGRPELLGPTALRERIAADIMIQLTTREVALIMKKFDLDGRGSVNIVDIFGNAKNQYRKLQHEQSQYKKRRDSLSKNNISASAPMLRNDDDSIISVEVDVEVEESSFKSDIQALQHKISQFAMESIQSNTIKYLNTSKPRITQREFRQLLAQLEVGLNSKEFSLLVKRYAHSETGLLDIPSFRSEYKTLGEKAMQEIRQSEAREAFIRVLSRQSDNTSGSSNGNGRSSSSSSNGALNDQDSALSAAAVNTLNDKDNDNVNENAVQLSSPKAQKNNDNQPTTTTITTNTSTTTTMDHRESPKSKTTELSTHNNNNINDDNSVNISSSSSSNGNGVRKPSVSEVSIRSGIQSLHSSSSCSTVRTFQTFEMAEEYIVPPSIAHNNNHNHNQNPSSHKTSNNNSNSNNNNNKSTMNGSSSSSSISSPRKKSLHQLHPPSSTIDAYENLLQNGFSDNKSDVDSVDGHSHSHSHSHSQSHGKSHSHNYNHSQSHSVHMEEIKEESDHKEVKDNNNSNEGEQEDSISSLTKNKSKRRRRRIRARSEGSALSTASSADFGDTMISSRGLATSGSKREGILPRAARGLLPDSAPKQAVSLKPIHRPLITEWRSEGLYEDAIGDLELLITSSYAMNGDDGDDDDDDEEEDEDEEDSPWAHGQIRGRNQYSDEEDNDDEDNQDGDDDDDEEKSNGCDAQRDDDDEDDDNNNDNNIYASNNNNNVDYSRSVDLRVARVEEVLRLAEDVLRMSSSSGLGIDRGRGVVPVDETRYDNDEEDDDELMHEEDDEEDDDNNGDGDDDGNDHYEEDIADGYEESRNRRERDRDSFDEDEDSNGDEEDEDEGVDEEQHGVGSIENKDMTPIIIINQQDLHAFDNDNDDDNNNRDLTRGNNSNSQNRLWILDTKNNSNHMSSTNSIGSNSTTRLRRANEHRNNQEEDQEDELRVRSRISNEKHDQNHHHTSGNGGGDEDDNAYESDDSFM